MKNNRNFRRILHFVKPYSGSVALNILFNILGIVFSLFSFSMIGPFLNILFNPDKMVSVRPEFSLDSDVLLNTLNYFVSYMIVNYGQATALIGICLMLITAFSA